MIKAKEDKIKYALKFLTKVSKEVSKTKSSIAFYAEYIEPIYAYFNIPHTPELTIDDVPTSCDAFNRKWKDYIEDNHYGMDIHHRGIIAFMDIEFKKEITVNPNFNYAQIKLKFNMARVYANSDKTTEWEDKIDSILKLVKPYKK